MIYFPGIECAVTVEIHHSHGLCPVTILIGFYNLNLVVGSAVFTYEWLLFKTQFIQRE